MPKYVPLDASNDKNAHFRTILLAFAALGFHVGVWAVLLADIARSLGLGPGSLGVALTCQAAAGVAALLLGGRFADRLGRRPVLIAGAAATGIYLSLLAFVESYAAFIAVLVFSGAVSMYDLAANALGGDYEREHDAKAMTIFHAAFSGAAALGALGSGVALALGADFRSVLAIAGCAVLAFAVAAIRLPIPRRISEGGGGGTSSGAFALLRVPAVFVCVAIVFMGFSTDAALEGYTSIYLRDFLGAGALLGGAGLASLYFAGAVSRVFGAVAISKFGERRVLFACGVAAALGLGILVATGMPSLAAVGLLVVGAALALVPPIAFSMTARAAPRQS